MNSKIVAVCGAPQVGKRTIIEALGMFNGYPNLIRKITETEPNTYLDIVSGSTALHLITRSGSYLRPDSMIPKVLTGACAVIYVLEPCLPNGSSVNFAHDFYQKYFEYYTQHAQKLGVFWADVPWLLVLNKTDLASGLPPGASLFPETFVNEITRCVATQSVGIPELWSKLVKKVTQR